MIQGSVQNKNLQPIFLNLQLMAMIFQLVTIESLCNFKKREVEDSRSRKYKCSDQGISSLTPEPQIAPDGPKQAGGTLDDSVNQQTCY